MSALTEGLAKIKERARTTNPIDALLAYYENSSRSDHYALTEALKERDVYTNKALFEVLQSTAKQAKELENEELYQLLNAVHFNTIIKYRQAL